MKIPKKLFAIFLLALVVIACDAITGTEVARLPVNALTTEDTTFVKEVTLDLKRGDEIVFWSDMDIAYEGDVALRFRVQLSKDSVVTGNLEIDPTDKNVTLGETKVSVNNKTTWSFTGRNAKVLIDDNGRYTFKTYLEASDNPTLKIIKAELVIKK